MAGSEVRRLREGDDRRAFECGDPDLDQFFREHVATNEFTYRACATYVVAAGGRVVAFATVVPTTVAPRALGRERRGLPGYPQPALRLARLGTDQRDQRRGHADQLMRQVFASAQALARDYGCIGVVLDAVPTAVGYYARFGFTTLQEPAPPASTTPMFLPRRKYETG
jgi:GNAT superfamily N-acetyltransferase